MPALKVLLSFDHELSLGGTDDYALNMFRPTDAVLDLAHELRVPVTLFTDVACAMRFKDWDPTGFWRPYHAQIHAALRGGNDVQLHIHPHWFDSRFDGSRFIPSHRFALGDFAEELPPHDIAGIVATTTDYLTRICLEADPSYRCVAFRAGGFNLSPATSAILSALYANGIRIDSSVAKGYRFRSRLSTVDFRNMPRRANWYMAVTGPVDREAVDGLFEIPIASRPRTPFNNLAFLAKRVLYRGRAPRASGRAIHAGNTSVGAKLARLVPSSCWMLGFDAFTDSIADQMEILDYHVRAHRDDDLIVCSAISHPKNMGAHSLAVMGGFVAAARDRYGDELEFTTYRAVADELNGRIRP